MKTLIFFLSSVISLSSFSSIPLGHAFLNSPDKKISGHAELRPINDGVMIQVEVKGLKPKSVYGFHIHETGKCDGPDFKSAGGHFNPEHGPHGSPTSSVKHIGDLGNIVANKNGVAAKEIVLKDLEDKEVKALHSKAFILHADPDDFSSQPSGDSGKRIACGIIKTTKK